MDRFTGKMQVFGDKNQQKLEIFGICDSVCVFRNGLSSTFYTSSSMENTMSADNQNHHLDHSAYRQALQMLKGEDRERYAKALLLSKIYDDTGGAVVTPNEIRKILNLGED